MNIVYEQPLVDYMHKKGKTTIVVEEVTSDSSDIEITELHVHLIDRERAEYFKKKKRYSTVTTEEGEVLFPPLRLRFSDTITFTLKSFLGIKYVSYQGIRI